MISAMTTVVVNVKIVNVIARKTVNATAHVAENAKTVNAIAYAAENAKTVSVIAHAVENAKIVSAIAHAAENAKTVNATAHAAKNTKMKNALTIIAVKKRKMIKKVLLRKMIHLVMNKEENVGWQVVKQR